MKVVTFGEIMLRLTPPGNLRLAQTPHFEITFGGAEANVAVMIAQLGGSADYVTKLPTNDIAQRAVNELRGLGVGIAGIVLRNLLGSRWALPAYLYAAIAVLGVEALFLAVPALAPAGRW